MSEINNENLKISEERIEEEINFQKNVSPRDNAIRIIEYQEKLKKLGICTITGLKNRETFVNDTLVPIENLLSHKKGKYCLLFVDIDNLKKINDTQGHSAGDNLMLRVSQLLQNNLKRKSDSVGKWTKGDEFIVFLPDANEQTAYSYYQRLVENISSDNKYSDVHFSIGASTCDFAKEENKTLMETINEADNALYKAKDNKTTRSGNVGMFFYKEIDNEQK